MSPEITGVLGVVILLVLFLLKMQVGLSMLIVGFLGYGYLTNQTASLAVIGQVPYSTASTYSLSVIPLFILMGMFLSYGGLGKDIYKAVDAWMRHLRGGMAIATIGACAAFSAVCGSATATAATIGTIALPEMKRYRYDDGLATAVVAAGGTLGILIPPSTILILYGLLTQLPIGKLLMAGLLPGLLQTFLFMITVYIQVRWDPKKAMTLPEASMKEKMAAFKTVWPILAIFVFVMGGIYVGIFTPTEAAAAGAFIAMIFSIITKRFTRGNLADSLDASARTTAMLFLILIGALVFSRFLAVTKIPMELSSMIAAMNLSPYVVIMIIFFVMVILGCFIEGISLMVLTLPILYPLVTVTLGFDGIWFGVLMVIMLNIGMVTPPVGMNVYVTAGVAKNVPLMTIFRGVTPFWIAMIACGLIIIPFPQIVTILPSLMK
jgi:tripartite ATP-independent transporter DctM subunit